MRALGTRRVSRSIAWLPRHRPRRYHVRSAQRAAATETARVTTTLRLPRPASAPAPSRAGITGIGTPPWLARTQTKSAHSAQYASAAMTDAVTVASLLVRTRSPGRADRSEDRGWH